MIVQEPVKAAIWHAVNHYAYNDAIFLAERLYAEVASDDALHLLATCYYQARRTVSAYSVLHAKGSRTPQCRFLLARCCVDLKKYAEAELALTGSGIAKSRNIEDIINEFGESASFVVQLLGQICIKTERNVKASESLRKSLKLNPFLWASYELLVSLGEKPDPSKIFTISNLDNFSYCHGSNPIVNLINKSNTSGDTYISCDVQQETSQLSTKISSMPMLSSSTGVNVHSPLALLRTSPEPNNVEVLTPENSSWIPVTSAALGKSSSKLSRVGRNIFGGNMIQTPLTPNFGILPLDTPSPIGTIASAGNRTLAYITPSPPTLLDQQSIDLRAPTKKQPMTRSRQTLNPSKFQIFGQCGNNNNNTTLGVSQTPSPQPSLQPGGLNSVRRSSRLFSSSNSVKENNKTSNKSSRFVSAKAPSKKTKAKSTKGSLSQSKECELNELNKPENQSENKTSANLYSIAQTAIGMQRASAEGLMQLLQDMGWARLYIGHYCCKKAIEILNSLPPQHYNTGWVLATLGRAYFELADYSQAVKMFQEVRRLESHRLQGMEYFSTALWHLQQEVSLSALAQELIDINRESPEAWCTAGNCFSLQKEHETAIKFLQRATQVDPDFAYAYTLLGHEHVLTEEMDRAMACFRSAIRIDPRHYNAWYGVGMIYYKQEKFRLAEVHFVRALAIHPQSSVLMCHIGIVQHALKKMDSSLATLNKAVTMDPKNPLCKFHRASIYFSLDRHQEALSELEELKQLVPKESLVYFLIGKVHKKLGNTHLALMNFSWAMDLDPKGANNQIKEAIDKRYTNEEDEVVASQDPTSDDIVSVGSGPADHDSSHDSSVMDVEDIHLQAMESDESF